MLTKAFQEKWAAALESGTYVQGMGCLREKDTYCCLGVAVDLIDPCTWVEQDDGQWVAKDKGSGVVYGGYFPVHIAQEVGLNYDAQNTLVHLNDKPVPFTEIAKYIRTLPTRD